jgi:hypothetical protein
MFVNYCGDAVKDFGDFTFINQIVILEVER